MKVIEDIRTSSRTMVRELGFMNSTIASSNYSASAVHTLIEIDRQGAMTASQLVQLLGTDKSSISRMIQKLIKAEEIREETTDEDSRVKKLFLTEKGERTVKQITEFARSQVENALKYLDEPEQKIVSQGLETYAQALKTSRLGKDETKSNSIEISCGYKPGLIGRVTEMHGTYYSRHSNFGLFFERWIATGLSDLAGRLEEPCNRVWAATKNNIIVGSIAIDGQDLGDNQAHLRFFILDDGCRGSGAGRRLLAEAVAFCDERKFDTIKLWTFKSLDAARKLYESFGFELVHEEVGTQWGVAVSEQQFVRKRPTSD